MKTKITVAIPVGPEVHHRTYLADCLESIKAQTRLPDEVLIIDDMSGLPRGLNHENSYPIHTWLSPWRVGVPAAFNFGVALAEHEWVFMLGADDLLLPECLQECEKAIDCEYDYLWVGVRYSDGRPDQYLPCHAAMVSKKLWKATGGFPPESAVGACDAAFISMALGSRGFPAHIKMVNGTCPLYHYRVGNNTDTAHRGGYQGAILQVRNLLTLSWKSPDWGRYA